MTTKPRSSTPSLQRLDGELVAAPPRRSLAAGALISMFVIVAGLPAGAAPTDYNLPGVELCATLTPPPAGAVRLEISTDPNFDPAVSTYAGMASQTGSDGGPRLSARFNKPSGVVQDSFGNVFIADTANSLIRMISPNGGVSTIAGTSGPSGFDFINGEGGNALFRFPTALALGPDENLFVADTFNHCIRKLTRPATAGGSWNVTTLAGGGLAGFAEGSGAGARFSFPQGLTVDAAGKVYVADSGNNRIRLVTPTGAVTTLAGSGTAGDTNGIADLAEFDAPFGVALDSTGALYVADRNNNLIRKVTSTGPGTPVEVTTYAGTGTAGDADGPRGTAEFESPVALAALGENLYISDKGSQKIRKVDPAGEVTTVAGTGGTVFMDGNASSTATFNCPSGLWSDPDGNLLVADTENHLIRRILVRGLTVPATVNGADVSIQLDAGALGLDSYVTYNFRWIDDTGTVLTPTAGAQIEQFLLVDPPTVTTASASLLMPTSAQLNGIVNPNQAATTVFIDYSTDPGLLGPLKMETFNDGFTSTNGIAVFDNNTTNDATDDIIYVADREDHQIFKITSAGTKTPFAGTGTDGFKDDPDGSQAQFDHPAGLAVDTMGNLYVADEFNHRIRKITPGGAVSTVAGSGVAGYLDDPTDALNGEFLYPTGVAVIGTGGTLYVADRGNHRIRRVSGPSLSTLAGDGTAGFAEGAAGTAQFNNPTAVAIDGGGNLLVADQDNHRIRLVNPSLSEVTTWAGSGSVGFLDDVGTAAQFDSPSGLAIDGLGNVYIADQGNHRLRLIDSSGVVSTVAGSGTPGLTDAPTAAGEFIPATFAQFNSPSAVAIAAGTTVNDSVIVYLSDTENDAVRKVSRDPLPNVDATPTPPPFDGAADTPVNVTFPETLVPRATYYFRARAENERAETIADIVSFTTPAYQKIAAFDGPDTAATPLSHAQAIPVDFGITPVDVAVIQDITIANVGEVDLTVSEIKAPTGYTLLTGGFELADPDVAITPGNAVTIQISLTGTPLAGRTPGATTYAGDLEIASNDRDYPGFKIPLTGVVLDPPDVITSPSSTGSTLTTATLKATINPNGSSTSVQFAYSQDPELDGFEVTTIAGSGTPGYSPSPGLTAQFDEPSGLATDPSGNVVVADTANHRIRLVAPDGTNSNVAGDGMDDFADGPGVSAQFNRPLGVVRAADGTLFVADSLNHRIRAISPTGVVSTHSGTGEASFTDGIATAARFNLPSALALAADGTLFVADRGNNRIRSVATDGTAGTLAGPADITDPIGVAVAPDGVVYATEGGSNDIRRIQPDGTVDTLALTGGTLSNPIGLAIDAAGNLLVADSGNHLIRSITPGGAVTTIVGTGTPGSMNGLDDVAQFNGPLAVVADPNGDIITSELTNAAIRRISSTTIVVEAATGLLGTDPIDVALPVSDLVPFATYYLRVTATNGGGTAADPATPPITATFTSRPPTPFEQWQLDNFGTDALTDPDADPNADPNGDGVSNLRSYAHLINPNLPGQDLSGLPAVSPKDGRLTLTYTSRVFIPDTSSDLVINVECSTDLITWGAAENLTRQSSERDITDPLNMKEKVLHSVPIEQPTASSPGSPQFGKGIRLSITLITQP